MSYLEQTGMLAKLLATENLIVEHSKGVETASFDTETRVLTLPMFSTSSRHVSNLLVAHEVSHALNTPTDWAIRVPDGVSFDFINVIEDVRIEKMIQVRYPGLRADFTRGYDELNNNDFFGINDTDVKKMKLIDRINLHFKLGARAIIPFTDAEMVYVRAVDEADTFDKVLLVAKMISDGITTDKSETENVASNSNQSGDTEQQSNDTQSQPEQPSNQEPSNDGNEQSNDDITSETANSSASPTDNNTSDTQKNFDEKMKQMLDKSLSPDNVYLSIPKIKVNDFVVDTDRIRESYYGEAPDVIKEEYQLFMDSIKRDVNFMVQQFEMRKSADAYARQQIHKTGVLNTSQLHNYKLTDDLFLRQTITPDGKSHGMVMYLDWSGSMANIAFKTIKQVLVLAQFCRKIGMPFEVYTMTTGFSGVRPNVHRQITLDETYLCRVLSSTAKRSDLDLDMLHLFCEGYSSIHYTCYTSPMVSMGGTPLNSALAVTPQIISEFRARTNAQKVSFVCLTDGESGPLAYVENNAANDILHKTYGWYNRILIRDGIKVLDLKTHNGMTGRLMEWIADDNTSVTNLFIGSERNCSSFVRSQNLDDNKIDANELRKSNSTSFQASDKWLICLLKPQAFTTSDDGFEVSDGATKAQIRTALKKHLKNKQTSRKLLTSLASQFS